MRRRPFLMRSCGGSSVMSSPKNSIRPEVGGKSPVMALNSVVLPAPLEPRMAYFSPAATLSETSSTARRAPNWRVTPRSTNASFEASAEAAPARRAAPGPPMAARDGRSWAIDATASRFLSGAGRHVARAHLELFLLHAEQLVDVVDLAARPC